MKRNTLIALMAVVMMASLSGCWRKPFQSEHGKQVFPHQTAFLVPKEGDTAKQGKLNSIEAYEACKVASKRIIIPTRWNKTGRGLATGEWLEMAELVLVDRTPVALHWTADSDTGTNNRNEAIWLESKDSIGSSIPIGNVYIHMAVFPKVWQNQLLCVRNYLRMPSKKG